MARPTKQGLDYFPLDVDIDQDDKVQLVEALHGIQGFGILIKLLMRIYREGYYYKWTETEQILLSKRVNVDIKDVQEIVNDCIKYGVFDSALFEQHEILTSKGIQKRYFEASSRRKNIDIKEEFLLINVKNEVNVNKNGVNANKNHSSSGDNVNKSTESKVKESKVNNSVQQVDFFESWWNLYNNKKGRVKCETKFNQLIKKYDYKVIENGTKRYLQYLNDLKVKGEFVPQQKNPLTFLNGEHFNDEYEQSYSQQSVPSLNYKPIEINMNAGED